MKASELRAVPVFEVLGDDELARVAAAGHERRLAPGEYLFRQGDHARFFHIVLDGQLETTRQVAGEDVLMMTHEAGGFLGALALLTGTPYRGTTRAAADTRLFEADGEELRRLAFTHPALLGRLLPALESVGGVVKGVERDREKVVAVGQLAAGLAHELNNPAAAARRAAATLREYERQRQAAFAELAGAGVPAAQLAGVVSLGAEAVEQTVPGEPLDPLAESDREGELLEAIEARGVPGAGDIASMLTEARLGPDWIDRVARAVDGEGLAAGLRFVAACAGARVLLGELEEATTRIVRLVDAVRSYSYLDQAPRQAVDIHAGLESTVSLLAHKLRGKGVDVVRDLDPDLPPVEAAGSELNQVWTNLIDNAIDAVGPDGQITLRTRRQDERVCVEIADNGPGIPPDLQARIYDAFFTTKPVGQGTGLGLDIARRIVIRHHGELRLSSQPGATSFRVLLPVG